MTLYDLKSCLEDKSIFGFRSTYGYGLLFEIGKPSLVIREYKSTSAYLKRMSDYVYDQKYFDVSIRGEISFFTDDEWILKRGHKIICDAGYEHSEIERILGFMLDGHSITNIIISNTKKRYVSLVFSNGLILRTKGKKGDNFAFFPDKYYTFEICPALGYKYYKNRNGNEAKWKQI